MFIRIGLFILIASILSLYWFYFSTVALLLMVPTEVRVVVMAMSGFTIAAALFAVSVVGYFFIRTVSVLWQLFFGKTEICYHD